VTDVKAMTAADPVAHLHPADRPPPRPHPRRRRASHDYVQPAVGCVSSMATFRYLTDDEACGLTRHELLDRVASQQAYYAAKRRKTAVDEAAMDELGRIIRRYLNINAAFDAAFATIGGYTGTSYWDTRPADDHPAGSAPAAAQDARDAGWPSSAASPQEQTAAVLARLTSEHLARLAAEEQP
jgi:hypothetical protein